MNSVFSLLLTTAMTSGTAKAMVPMNLSTRYTGYQNIADHRNNGEGAFSLSQYEFQFGLRTFNDQNYKAHLQVGLPLRTLQMDSGSSQQIGSEFGGYRITWTQTLYEFLGWDLSYFNNTSPRLGLFAENQNFETLGSLKKQAFLGPSILVKALAGPGIRITNVGPSAEASYGPMYIARAGVEAIWANELLGKFAIGIASVFRLRASYRDDTGSMSASLFTLQPQLAWELVDDLWLNAQYTRALARPAGFEQAMGDAGLSGLYGDSIGIGISTLSM